MDTPYGPRKITGRLQIAIPVELAERVEMQEGDQIYFIYNDERPDVLRIVRIDVMHRWINAGQKALDDQD